MTRVEDGSGDMAKQYIHGTPYIDKFIVIRPKSQREGDPDERSLLLSCPRFLAGRGNGEAKRA
jgi:hypothetical protein